LVSATARVRGQLRIVAQLGHGGAQVVDATLAGKSPG
jgi:hypothetical protein